MSETKDARVAMEIRIERDDSIPAIGGFLRCKCQDADHPVILLNVQALMSPTWETDDGEEIELSREERKRALIGTIMHEFGHALEVEFGLPPNEEALEKACREWEEAYGKSSNEY